MLILGMAFALSSLHAQTLPAAYDLRNEGLAPAMQNQGNSSICWAYASSTAIESNLVKKGLIQLHETDLHVSPWHMAANAGSARSIVWSPVTGDYEWDDETHSWGDDAFGANLGYLTRGRGEWSLPNAVPGRTIATIGGGVVDLAGEARNQTPQEAWARHQPFTEADLPVANQPTAWLTRGLYKINDDDAVWQQQAVKEAIYKYGAVSSDINVEDGEYTITAQSGGERNTYYYTQTTTEGAADHEVTIIGWDDDYVTSTGTGAWIIQNSWGSPASDEEADLNGRGIFYVSYTDTIVGRNVTVFDMEGMGNYSDTVVQNHIMSMDEGATMKEVQGFRAATLLELNGLELGGVGLYGERDQVISVSLYDAMGWGEDGNWTIDPSMALYTFDLLFELEGYQLVDLGEGIILPDGTRLLVIVDYGAEADITYIPLSQYENAEDYEGLSYYYNGSDWVDFASNEGAPGVHFLKGFTLFSMIPEPGSCILVFFGMGALLLRRRA